MGVLNGKVAIVTGTSRGVGVGIAHELLRAGATVVGCSRSPLDTIPGIDADWAARASQQVCESKTNERGNMQKHCCWIEGLVRR